MPCRFANSGTVATSRSASRAIRALNVASNFSRDLVISVLHRLRQSRTLHTLTFGPISGVHFRLRGPASRILMGTRLRGHQYAKESDAKLVDQQPVARTSMQKPPLDPDVSDIAPSDSV